MNNSQYLDTLKNYSGNLKSSSHSEPLNCEVLFFEDNAPGILPFSTMLTAGLALDRYTFEVKCSCTQLLTPDERSQFIADLGKLVSSNLAKEASTNYGKLLKGTLFPFERMHETVVLPGEYTNAEFLNTGEKEVEVLMLLPIYKAETSYFQTNESTKTIRRMLRKADSLDNPARKPVVLT